jgi:hypothetical protein
MTHHMSRWENSCGKPCTAAMPSPCCRASALFRHGWFVRLPSCEHSYWLKLLTRGRLFICKLGFVSAACGTSCFRYTYLGDIVTFDAKSVENLVFPKNSLVDPLPPQIHSTCMCAHSKRACARTFLLSTCERTVPQLPCTNVCASQHPRYLCVRPSTHAICASQHPRYLCVRPSTHAICVCVPAPTLSVRPSTHAICACVPSSACDGCRHSQHALAILHLGYTA